jgi:hypothetical protein
VRPQPIAAQLLHAVGIDFGGRLPSLPGPRTGRAAAPARSFGPALGADEWHDFWIYIAGALTYEVVRGNGSTEETVPMAHARFVCPHNAGRSQMSQVSALMRELHARLPPGSSYVLLVVAASIDARAFYERHGLIDERRVAGPSYYRAAMATESDAPPLPATALLMRYISPRGPDTRVFRNGP